jgi:hypothetical protein
MDCKLNFYQSFYFIFSHAIKLPGLIHAITLSFSTIDSLMILCLALVRSKPECALVAWNSVSITDPNKPEGIQRNIPSFATVYLFQNMQDHYDKLLQKLCLQALHIRSSQSGYLFLMNVYNGAKCCSSPQC